MPRDYSPILKSILSAAASALNEEGRSTGRTELIPGALPAWDDCCEGQLYLRVIDAYPTMGPNAPFPQKAVTLGCGFHGLAVHIGLGIIRCVATVDENGQSPTPDEVTADADVMLDDMSTLLDVLMCSQYPGVLKLILDQWLPQGADGGCAGGEWSAYLLVDPCLCKEG